jgi:hypothetical protein
VAVDYEAFSPEERDTFVKNILHEKEIAAAIRAATGGGARYRSPDQLLEFCFRVAVKKMEGLKGAIRDAREKENG